MAKVHKTIGDAKANLEAATTYIPERYRKSVARADWESPTISDQAEANWKEGLTAAMAADARRKGVKAVGNAKYQKAAIDKGGAVIGTRIKAAIEDYARNFAPVLDAMIRAADAAPPRTRDWRVNVEKRLYPVVEAAIENKRKKY